MPNLAVLVPAKRPWRVHPTIEAFKATADCQIYFICDAEDHELIEIVDKAADEDEEHIILTVHSGNYAEKINYGCRLTDHPLIFLGADDLEPLPGWLTHASAPLNQEIGVVGINDLIVRRMARSNHATHFLMARWYAELPTIDGKQGPLHTGYHHWQVDDELIATAKYRNAYAYAPDAHVKHLHPMNGTAPDDEVYEKGRWGIRLDARRFDQRVHLWT